jgi:predicted RNA-binding Zn-ribbon protein involved in translation (DUF1610 family)
MPEVQIGPLMGDGFRTLEKAAVPVCLSCGQDTHFIRRISSLGVLPEILVFHCPNCRSVYAVQPIGLGRNVGSTD